jgi:hypothetical protein
MNAQLGTDLALASRCVAAILPPRCRVTRRRGADWTVGGQSHSYTVLSLLPSARHVGYGFLPVSHVDLSGSPPRDSPGGRSNPSRRGVQPIRRRQPPRAGTAGAEEQILASRDWLAPDEVGELSRLLVALRIVKVF